MCRSSCRPGRGMHPTQLTHLVHFTAVEEMKEKEGVGMDVKQRIRWCFSSVFFFTSRSSFVRLSVRLHYELVSSLDYRQ